MQRVLLQPSYILHQRDYRNTSAILEILTRDHGRVSIVAKGIKAASGSQRRGLLQPFLPLLISYAGKYELCTLTAVEAAGDDHSRLQGQALFSGFYLNELLMYLLQRGDPHEQLFRDYADTVSRLKSQEACEPVLRRFEMCLLQELGYGLALEAEAITHHPIDPANRYYYDPLRGPVSVESVTSRQLPTVSGACLQALAHADFSDRRYWAEMKILMRSVIGHHMDGRPLNSRELFQHDS
ncbi:MAG TPA: DNA repair protein RecO [Gammaproteobacteria bacterium]